MPTKNNLILFLFIIISLLNIWAGENEISHLVFWTKIFLMPTLALWFYLVSKNQSSSFRNLILGALFFSWAGDTFLLFVESKGELFFLLGLGHFLIAHLLYFTAFLKIEPKTKGLLQYQPWLALPFLVILFGFLYYLMPDLGNILKVPVSIYSSVIMIMVLASLNLGKKTPLFAFQLIFIGALFFMSSDMMIAINKFKTPLPASHFLIMGTYLIGQFLIAKGSTILIKTKN